MQADEENKIFRQYLLESLKEREFEEIDLRIIEDEEFSVRISMAEEDLVEDYLDGIRAAGFANVSVPKDRAITIPDDILSNYLSADEIEAFKQSGNQITSVTVYGEKPTAEKSCCSGDCCS